MYCRETWGFQDIILLIKNVQNTTYISLCSSLRWDPPETCGMIWVGLLSTHKSKVKNSLRVVLLAGSLNLDRPLV